MQLVQTSDGPVYVPFSNVGVGHGEHCAICNEGGFAAPSPPHSVISFVCGEYLCWVLATTYCASFSAVLILVVKILGGGGTSSGLW